MLAKDYNLDWSVYFRYDEESPSGLVWNCPRLFKGVPKYDRIGTPVGSISKQGYWSVGLGDGSSGRCTYLIHRIIAVMVHGEIGEDEDVDHIDRNKSNNRIENLRVVSKSENMRNKDIREDNNSGIVGVSLEGNGYRAQFVDRSGKILRKYFSINKYGDKAIELAENWRKEMEITYEI